MGSYAIAIRKFRSGFNILRERGFFEFLKVLYNRIYYGYQAYWYVCDLVTPNRTFSLQDEGSYVVDHLFEETVSWMVSLNTPGIAEPREIENMRNEDHLVYTLLSNNSIVGYINIGKGHVYILDFDQTIDFPKKTGFVMDTFIHENYRGKNLFNLLISNVKLDLQKKGYKKLYCHIRTDNAVSVAAYEKNDFSRLGFVEYKRILWKTFFKYPQDILKG